jgi:hypothetical protein
MKQINLGSVDLSCLSFVRIKCLLLAALGMQHSCLCKFLATKRKKHLNESKGQRLLAISTALSLIRVE